jgi:hypothetical protein
MAPKKEPTPATPPPAEVSMLEKPTQVLVEACCDVLYALSKISEINSDESRDETAAAGYMAKALLQVEGRLSDSAGNQIRQAMQMPPSRDPYELAAKVTRMVFDSLRAGAKAKETGVDNSKALLARIAEVFPKHTSQHQALATLAELSQSDERARQADHRVAHDRRLGEQAARAHAARVRGFDPKKAQEPPGPVIEVQAPHSSMGGIPGVSGSGDLDPNPIGDVEVPRVS